MPIEIKELHIKINVSDSGNSAGTADSSAAPSDMTQQAVEEVMELLRKQKER